MCAERRHDLTLVTTTIRVPKFLEGVLRNAKSSGSENLCVMVIADKKTPPEARDFCASLSGKSGVPIEYYGVEDQDRTLAPFPELLKLLPYHSGSRKMIGNFMAWLRGCKCLVMLDDDNFVTEEDFLGGHSVVREEIDLDVFQTDSGWFNVYEALQEEKNIPFFPRGFPWKYRIYGPTPFTRTRRKVRVAVNNGLVLENPDIDAIARLFWPICVAGFREGFPTRFGLSPGIWSSWNNQNTALSGEVLPAYFTPPSTGRNADIWTSFVVCRLAEQMEEVISFGNPLVRQVRNPHNLFQDLEDEFLNNRLTDDFVELLRSVPLRGKTYPEALGELLSACLDRLETRPDGETPGVQMMIAFFREYRAWHEICLKGERWRTS